MDSFDGGNSRICFRFDDRRAEGSDAEGRQIADWVPSFTISDLGIGVVAVRRGPVGGHAGDRRSDRKERLAAERLRRSLKHHVAQGIIRACLPACCDGIAMSRCGSARANSQVGTTTGRRGRQVVSAFRSSVTPSPLVERRSEPTRISHPSMPPERLATLRPKPAVSAGTPPAINSSRKSERCTATRLIEPSVNTSTTCHPAGPLRMT